MKKYILLLSMSLLVVPIIRAEYSCGDCCNITSHSFYSARPLYQSASPERITLFRDRLHARECGNDGALELTFFGSKTQDPASLSAFFGPSCKPQFTVTSAQMDGAGDFTVRHAPEVRDIAAQHLNIYLKGGFAEFDPTSTNGGIFESAFCLDPEQTVIGLGITFKKAFYEMCDGQWFWFELSSPLTHVKNRMCIHETIKSDGQLLSLDAVGSVSEAFAQSSWLYGKIDPCCIQSETKFADLELKLGYEWLKNDCCFFESYIGALIPTGNRVTGRFMFEPIVGHNRHPGIMCGSTGIFEWWQSECCDCYAEFAIDWNSLYLFEKVETRSFDLKNKPWSRYMPVYANKEQAEQAADLDNQERDIEAILLHTPGINVFTQPLCVKPKFAHTFNSAFIFNCCKSDCCELQAEVGYNVFFRSAECVKLACCWEEGPALKSVDGQGYTNRYQTIDDPLGSIVSIELGVEDYEKNIITECDLDLASAAHPAVLSHTIYGSAGCRWDNHKYPTFMGIGFSYEFADDNAAADRWIAWVKGGVSF